MSTTTPSLEISKAQPLFDGKAALITGGTSGIGAATVNRVSALGASVLFTGRRIGEAKKIIREAKQNTGRVVFFPSDLSNSEEVKKIVPMAVATFGPARLSIQQCWYFRPNGIIY
jgi:NAD(P)-dependent dehydrogenase (short-subunit alcohol dehydrogenase family)